MSNRLLWLGSFHTQEIFSKTHGRFIGQASGFASQKGILKGLYAIIDKDTIIDTIGTISIRPWPNGGDLFAPSYQWHETPSSVNVITGYFNIPYLNYFNRGLALRHEVKKWTRSLNTKDKVYVVVYEPSIAKLNIAAYLRRHYHASVYVVIPDIPEFVNQGAGKIIKIGKKIVARKMEKAFHDIDGFILYSSLMAEYYHFPVGKWILMEGVYDDEEMEENESLHLPMKKPLKLMYSGAITKDRGIPQLLKAFSGLQGMDCELWFTGVGDADELVFEQAQKDARIKHFGYLNSREDVLKIQLQADVLLHIRDVEAISSRYCFPSKLFEYLVSGKPVISVVIPGIPDEYFKHMFSIETMSKDSIINAIQTVTNTPDAELKLRGVAARNFVLNEKNPQKQAGKILDFIGIPCK